MAELLEATRKMTKFLKDHLNITNLTLMAIATPPQVQIIITTPTQTNTNQAIIVMKSMKLLTQHTHLKSHLQNLKITKNAMTQTALIAYLTPPQSQNDYQMKTKLLKLNKGTQNMPQITQSQLITLKHCPYLTQALPSPVCQKHVLPNWTLNLN